MGNYQPGIPKTFIGQHPQQTTRHNHAKTSTHNNRNTRLASCKCSATNLHCQHNYHPLYIKNDLPRHHIAHHEADSQQHLQQQPRYWVQPATTTNNYEPISPSTGRPPPRNHARLSATLDRYPSNNKHNTSSINLESSTTNTSTNVGQIPLTKSKLPSGFTKRQTSHGQIFFVDTLGRKYWYDPSVPQELLDACLNLDEIVGKLSSTWEVKQTSTGKIYYVNHNKRTTQFTDPRLVAYREYLMSVLSPQQLLNKDSNCHTNFTTTTATPGYTSSVNNRSLSVDAPTRSTLVAHQQTPSAPPLLSPPPAHPQTQSQPPTASSDLMSSLCNLDISSNTLLSSGPNSKSFNNINIDNKILSDKISILRQELIKQQIVSHSCKIDIRRRKIFEESFRIISQMNPRDLKKRLNIRFRGEEGVDFGGVAREWFYLLSREMLNPVHGLFQYTSSDIYNLQINPDSGIVYSEHLSYMHFCGRVIGMAVFHGHFTEGHFTLPFYKMLLRRPITLHDIEFVDPELYRSLCWMLENDITDVIDTTFLVHHNAFGQLQEHELKENGKDITVTEKNKHEYVSLYVNYRCKCGIEKQYEALQRGFDELIEPSLLQSFNEHELELLIGGLSKINIDDWRINTKLKNCTIESSLVKWFWDIVKCEFDENKRAKLLQFVTGSPRVPMQGFKALRAVGSELRPFTIHLIKNGNTNDLPKSHTCFNRLDLPPYETYDKLRDKLKQAIEETIGFGMQ